MILNCGKNNSRDVRRRVTAQYQSKPKRQRIGHPLRTTALLLIALAVTATGSFGSSLIYKNYIVRYDRGWDILCEPYVVQKNDWVLKIFRQKGEIAHRDFRDFMGIFQRLNPHIKDVDVIRPGQRIDIPLRKLEQGALSGQESGVVTIPFVTLARVNEVITTHSRTYQVRRGDTVSRLLAREFGRFGSQSYQEAVKMFKAANPQVTDIDKIYAGQKVYLPDPTIREKQWYSAIYDEEGNLKETLDRGRPTGAAPQPPLPLPAATQPAKPETTQPKSPIVEAAAAVGGTLYNKGTYYLPKDGANDFELDLSQHPMLELPSNQKMVFTSGDAIMDMDAATFESQWTDIDTVKVNDDDSVETVIGAIFESMEQSSESAAAEVSFEDNGVLVAVRAKWMRAQTEGRQLCITPISGADQRTPDTMRRYLERNGIDLKEILPGGSSAAMENDNMGRHAVKNILALAPENQKDFVKTIAQAMGLGYAPNIAISFPYAGIQVQAYADLISSPSGTDVFVDFGDLYGDALTAIANTGITVLQITEEESNDTVVRKLLTALGLAFEPNPTFLAAERPAEFNIQVTVAGIAYTTPKNKQLLLSGTSLPAAVSDLLNTRGYHLVVW